jgi:hypothetical protein
MAADKDQPDLQSNHAKLTRDSALLPSDVISLVVRQSKKLQSPLVARLLAAPSLYLNE